ncbi:hypothetical protein GCM10010405_09560 [Streptomyces macrosporus]|uniref:Uncharacterized protein n=1 Tax=Streptomyces macrosporus TaxID=44032 RepID=A0ABP5WPQ4_9ACTN
MRFPLAHWVLAPRTTWRARRIAATSGLDMDARTAWVVARLTRRSEEYPYAMRRPDGEDLDETGPGSR